MKDSGVSDCPPPGNSFWSYKKSEIETNSKMKHCIHSHDRLFVFIFEASSQLHIHFPNFLYAFSTQGDWEDKTKCMCSY